MRVTEAPSATHLLNSQFLLNKTQVIIYPNKKTVCRCSSDAEFRGCVIIIVYSVGKCPCTIQTLQGQNNTGIKALSHAIGDHSFQNRGRPRKTSILGRCLGDTRVKRGLEDCTEEVWMSWLGMSASAPSHAPLKLHPWLAAPVLAEFHYCCDKTASKINLAHRLQSIMEESQRRTLEAGTEAKTVEEHFSLACSTYFLIQHLPRGWHWPQCTGHSHNNH